jgi:hypothetical protein
LKVTYVPKREKRLITAQNKPADDIAPAQVCDATMLQLYSFAGDKKTSQKPVTSARL